ncbi:MAG: hypothetical protein ACOYUZ_04370 [Patescibacteria group bacterium]
MRILHVALSLSLLALIGCGSTFRDQYADRDGNIITQHETSIGPWGVDTIDTGEYARCRAQLGPMPYGQENDLCQERILVRERNKTWGGGYYNGYYGQPYPYYDPYYNHRYRRGRYSPYYQRYGY